ncbi:acyltransferase [Shimia litoralis]|uniref:Acyltransferase n=1 Tax=Shimia litoralis TaxID=420403 RepID=A0A4U7N5S9_9RHOB|nr:lysophospholipid acyltransferase family protein [Shimia litoralis]TKZ20933.1 acyltransferase [Shimia litoralis]
MTSAGHAARDISYAQSATTKGGRAVIRMMENATGRVGLIKRAQGYDADIAHGKSFWETIVDRYGLRLDVMAGSLMKIPRDGPLIVVANHPYGILDGLMLGHILAQRRGEFHIMAHRVFHGAQDINAHILPISFDNTRRALELNLRTRKTAHACLQQGGAIGIFPGGTVSTAATPFGQPLDPAWRKFTARLVMKSGATVVPIFFDGQTSRLFQIASHLHTTLRMGLLMKEFRKRVDTPVRVAIGAPVDPTAIQSFSHDAKGLMDFLRAQTYALSPKPMPLTEYGFEFEEKYRA